MSNSLDTMRKLYKNNKLVKDTFIVESEKLVKKVKQSIKELDNLPKVKYSKEDFREIPSKKSVILRKDEITDLVMKIGDTAWSKIKQEKSYSHKPHLASLPYDHARGRTLEQLVERHNAINDRVKELKKERESLVKKSSENSDQYYSIRDERDDLIDRYQRMREDNQKFFEASQKVKEEKMKVYNSILDRINSDVVVPTELRARINRLPKYLNSGWVNNEEFYTNLANDIVDWRYSIEKDDTEWGNIVDGIADDVRVMGDNEFFNKDLPNLYKTSHDEGEFSDLVDEIKGYQKDMDKVLEEGKQISKDIKKVDRIFDDYFEDQRKIKWTAFKNGLLDDTMSEEDKQRANEYIKKHNL